MRPAAHMNLWIAVLTFLLGSLPVLRAAEGWRPLWDGKTLDGWHRIGDGKWTIENGAIHGTRLANEQGGGFLVTDRVYTDFSVRLKFKLVGGNSGLFIRIEERSNGTVMGLQAEIDATGAGGLFEANGRKWVFQPQPEQVAKWFKSGEWNEMMVSARGGRIAVTINGTKSIELPDDPGRREGKIALQVHGRPLGCDVWFRDIEIQTGSFP